MVGGQTVGRINVKDAKYYADPSMTRLLFLVLAAALVTALGEASSAAGSSLPAFNADINQTSISGISSGAFMAVQFGTAWSSIIKGVGAIAGGPFGCSEGSVATALSTCMGGAPALDVDEYIRRTDAWSSSGAIDETRNISAQKIYLFNGYNDTVINRAVTNGLDRFYAHFLGRNSGNLFYQTAIGAGHSQVTLNFGADCSENSGEFINKCDYDQAGVILQHIYGALDARHGDASAGKFLSFNQAEFTAPNQPIEVSMGDKGFTYVPTSCAANEPCRVHVALHGCEQSFGDIGEDFVRHAGYNEWADTNHIIVLYPQTQTLPLSPLGITNPEACWDWFGYLDADPAVHPSYLLKSGAQMRAIKAMIDRLTSGASSGAAAAPPPPPAAPTKLLATDHTDTAIDIVWTPVAGGVAYDVFRAAPADTEFQQIATTSGLSFGDAGLKPATPYRYKVRASAAAGAAAPFSPAISQTTAKKVPACNDPGTCPVR